MQVFCITKIQLTDDAAGDLSMRDYQAAVDWLKTWTVKSNFKALTCKTLQDAVVAYRSYLAEKLVPNWLKAGPEHFQFELSSGNDVDEAGFFWLPGSVVTCSWYRVMP